MIHLGISTDLHVLQYQSHHTVIGINFVIQEELENCGKTVVL